MEEMNFKNFLKNVVAAGKGSVEANAALKTTGYLEEGQGSMGGFLLPTPKHDQVMGVALENSVVRQRATIIPMTSAAITIARIVDTTHASNVLGGVSLSIVNELVALSESNPAFGQLTLRPRKLVGYCYTSSEWLEDSFVSGEALLTQAFGEAIGFYADDFYINGSGVNEPLGILNSGSLIAQARAGATITWADVLNMDARLLPMSEDSAIWLINSDMKPALYAVTVAGSDSYIYSGPEGVFMLGKKLVPSEKCPAFGTQGDIILADFGRYVIGDHPLAIASSGHYMFDSDTIAWRFILRTDGQPIPVSPTTPKNGANTQSPFIVLGGGGSSSSSSMSSSSSSSSA